MDPFEPKKVIGCITRHDVITSYNQESLKYNMTESFAQELKELNQQKEIQVTANHMLLEVAIPERFIGKTMSKLHLRNRWNIEVLMVKHGNSPFNAEDSKAEVTFPDPEYVFKEGDRIVIFASKEALEKVRNW